MVELVIVVGPGIVNTVLVDDPSDIPLLEFSAYAVTVYVVPETRPDKNAVVALVSA